MKVRITPNSLEGTISVPPSKSQTMRAIVFATMAKGESVIYDFLPSPDTDAMIKACELLGAKIEKSEKNLKIKGVSGKPQTPNDVIDAKNSGLVLRFSAAISALAEGYTVLTGDASIRFNRPMMPLIQGLEGLGARCISTKQDGFAPAIIKGPIHPGKTQLDGTDSQPVSALLVAASFLSGKTEIHVTNPGEKPWILMTLDWFKRLNISCVNESFQKYTVKGKANYEGFEYRVPKDFSSACFFLVAGLLKAKNINLEGLDFSEPQGDRLLFNLLKSIGGKITTLPNLINIKKTEGLLAQTINVNDAIDSVPILSVLACSLKGTTRLTGAKIAKNKESNRLQTMATELGKMGANIKMLDDGLLIEKANLSSAVLQSYQDHRIAMALSIAALTTEKGAVIDGVECVKKSYPSFFEDLKELGVGVEFL